MGKPYQDELKRLPETYAWAHDAPLGDLPRMLRAVAALPLVGVGSGGSFTTAEFAAAAHRLYSSSPAAVMTPLEAVTTPQSLRQSAVMLATAGGRNPDVLGAFERLAEREPRRFVVLCARAGSPLGRAAARHPAVDFAEFEPPSGKDGFLATSSLLASAVLLGRAYAAAYAAESPHPERFSGLLPAAGDTLADIDRRCEPLWKRPSLVVLFGPECRAAAVDLESKFSEAALGPVQLADFRNFAHGRHHWLAKRGAETAVLALVSDADQALADTLLALLPKDVPVVRLPAAGAGLAAGLSALVQVFAVAGSAGKARGIDPGDPGVPPFGRKIYHLRAFAPRETEITAAETAAVERKSGASVPSLLAGGALDRWRAAHRAFSDRLSAARFGGVVFDYDGTLCAEAHRFEPLPAAVARHLNRLLRGGAVLGIATGRGKSVKKTLREAVKPRYWGRVVVGYYNGGDVAPLTDDARPDGEDAVGPSLAAVAEALRAAFPDAGLVKLTLRLPQITVEPGPDAHAEGVWNTVQHLIHASGGAGVAAVRSSHSMDVVAAGVTKRAVVERVRDLLPARADAPVLCIGDRGRWPGNDHALLSTPFALSVDEVSPDPETGWNLAAPGRRGADAALDYLARLAETPDGLRMTIE